MATAKEEGLTEVTVIFAVALQPLNVTVNVYVPGVDTFPYAITIDANNDFYFSGHFRSQIDLNPGSGTTSIFSNGNSFFSSQRCNRLFSAIERRSINSLNRNWTQCFSQFLCSF